MSRTHLWIDAWIGLFDSIVTILTFTLIRPSLSYRFTVWSSIREAKKRLTK